MACGSGQCYWRPRLATSKASCRGRRGGRSMKGQQEAQWVRGGIGTWAAASQRNWEEYRRKKHAKQTALFTIQSAGAIQPSLPSPLLVRPVLVALYTILLFFILQCARKRQMTTLFAWLSLSVDVTMGSGTLVPEQRCMAPVVAQTHSRPVQEGIYTSGYSRPLGTCYTRHSTATIFGQLRTTSRDRHSFLLFNSQHLHFFLETLLCRAISVRSINLKRDHSNTPHSYYQAKASKQSP
jgi:hypothetical protein